MAAPMQTLSSKMFQLAHLRTPRAWQSKATAAALVQNPWYRCYSSELERRRAFELEYREEGKLVPQAKPTKFFPKLAMPTDLLVWLQQDFDISVKGFRKWWAKRMWDTKLYDQRYIADRNRILGADLAAAHFLVHRGAAVRFVGSEEWIRKDYRDAYTLPQSYVPNVRLEAIDVGDMEILYEGLVNIELLSKVRWLSLRNCKRVDDWFLDRLSTFRETLEYLDLSGCVNVTERGLPLIARFEKLKVLKMYDMTHIKHLNLVCILLEEALPNCTIEGVDFMNPAVLGKEAASPDAKLLGADAAALSAGDQAKTPQANIDVGQPNVKESGVRAPR